MKEKNKAVCQTETVYESGSWSRSFTKQLHDLKQVTTALNPSMSLFEVINQREVLESGSLSRTP